MKSLFLIASLILSLSSNAATATIFRIFKNINSKNVLFYKVNYDKKNCTFTSDVYADWKMDAEDGRWKPLSKSSKKIKEPLWPRTSRDTKQALSFETNAINDFQQEDVIDSSDIKVFIDKQKDGKCLIRNLVLIDKKDINVSYLYTKMTFWGSITDVSVVGKGFDNNKEFKKDVSL